MNTITVPEVKYCKRCVAVSLSAIPLTFNDEGICSACLVHEQKDKINWAKRYSRLRELLAEYKSDGSNYDCIIPVSGGKDSYFQTHTMIEEFGLKPLLVTYHGNNYLPEGTHNLNRMRHVFNTDHIVFRPSEQVLKRLNKKCFYLMGDMNWHAHAGIFTYPVQIAVKFKIPLIIWGEHGYTDLGGMYSMNDLVEMTRKYRTEHAMRGYDWYDMVDEEGGLNERDLLFLKYPEDDELDELDVRGIYLGNYLNWSGSENARIAAAQYRWKASEVEFERTYRKFSNLDDMHENGIHDYLKYIKFGYGRATDHACKDIRSGKMSREEAIEKVKKYDHVKPKKDLERWLDYVSMTEDEFDRVCDSFRDPRVWVKSGNEWIKRNIWD